MMKFLQWAWQLAAAKWAAMTPTAKTFAIALPAAFVIMEFPGSISWLPDDLKKDAQGIAYWTWKGALAFISWHIIGGRKTGGDVPKTPDAGKFVVAIIAGLCLTGCQDSLYDPRTGNVMARWSSDRAFFYYVGNGVSTGSQSALFSPVIRAQWHGGATVVGAAAAGAIGWRAVGAGGVANTLIGGATSATTAVTTRPTATAPAVLQAH